MNPGQLVNQDSGDTEMYTPVELIEAARRCMGTIDLDPASSIIANETVKADLFFTKENDGLNQDWFGNTWLNHPFSKGEKACHKDRKKCKKKICNDPTYSKYRGYHIDKDIPSNNDWIDYLIDQYRNGNIKQSCNITFGSTSESWYQKLAVFPQCIIDGRTQYRKPSGKIARGITKGSVVTYLGSDIESFAREYSVFGRIHIDYDMIEKLKA